MQGSEKDIASLSAGVRLYALSPASQDASELAPLVQSFITTRTHADLTAPHVVAPLAECAMHFARILHQTKDPKGIRECLRALLRAGRFGRILAVRFVHGKSVSLRELAAIVSAMQPHERLTLAHEMLLDYPGQHDKQTSAWLEGLMTPLAGVDPREIATAVADLGAEGETLAFPVRQVLLNGRFAEWMHTRLETGASGEELEEMCHIVAALNDPGQAVTLAVSMSVGFIAPTPLALHTVSRIAEAGDKRILDMFLKVLKSGRVELAGPCLDGIIAQNTPAAGKLLATIRMKMPSMRRVAISRVPLLGDTAYVTYLRSLPKEARPQALKEGVAALLHIAPDFVEALTRVGTAKRRRQGKGPATVPADTTGGSIPAEKCEAPGFFAKLFGKRKKTLEKHLGKSKNFKEIDLSCSNLDKSELDGFELTTVNLNNSTFNDVTIIRSNFGKSTLCNVELNGGSATGTTFSQTDFTGADFANVRFVKCSFNNCNFTGAAFSGCTFTDCRFRNCAMGGTAFVSGRMERTGVTTSILSGASLFEIDIRSCRFEDVDFSSMECVNAKLAGVEFINSVFRSSSFDGAVFHSVDMPGSSVIGCPIHNCDMGHALLLNNRLNQLPVLAGELELGSLPDPAVVPPESSAKLLSAWSKELTYYRREARMTTYNRQRLQRAISSIEQEKQVYMRILPYLMTTDVFERKFELDDVPSCDVWGYVPGLTTLELAKQYFPEHKPSRGRAQVNIVAVYAMGSLGTVAQTAKSDIDAWVCYEGDISLDAEVGLKRKLDALGLWAESEFGLEAHFFPMRMDDVRENRFSSGDEESSGSAQALLLKEEFYRTALKIAGKNIAWWVTLPGADKLHYDETMVASRRYPITGRPRLEDFGHLAPVPPDEYFGGSLWQMVKAVHSPFKSVLKLGLLEAYADPSASSLPLCDRIKQNLFMNRHGAKRTDPYASLFSVLRSYYIKRGDKEAAALLAESFKLKINLCDIPFFMNLPARFEDQSLLEAMFGKDAIDPEKICGKNDHWSFNKSLNMGSSVRQYMVHTYQRIQEALSEGGSTDALINPEDLTRMGRRIGSNFAKKKSKIMRVPFMDIKGEGFPILHFSAEKAPGRKPVWVVRGGTKAEAKKSAESLQLLHRSGDPAHMLAWLLANRMYSPKSLLQADRTIAPIAVADLQKLMPAMYEFFPFDDTFERDINEGLESERVIRVFLVFNLTSPPDTKKIETAAAIYTTNWGEMFCRTFTKPDKLLEEYPSKFLATHLKQPVTDVPHMILFIPKGSQCKRINLI